MPALQTSNKSPIMNGAFARERQRGREKRGPGLKKKSCRKGGVWEVRTTKSDSVSKEERSNAREGDIVKSMKCCWEPKDDAASTVPSFLSRPNLAAKCCYSAHQSLYKCQVARPFLQQPLGSSAFLTVPATHVAMRVLRSFYEESQSLLTGRDIETQATCVIWNHQDSQKIGH